MASFSAIPPLMTPIPPPLFPLQPPHISYLLPFGHVTVDRPILQMVPEESWWYMGATKFTSPPASQDSTFTDQDFGGNSQTYRALSHVAAANHGFGTGITPKDAYTHPDLSDTTGPTLHPAYRPERRPTCRQSARQDREGSEDSDYSDDGSGLDVVPLTAARSSTRLFSSLVYIR